MDDDLPGPVGDRVEVVEPIDCDEPGCETGDPVIACWLPDDTDEPSDHLCLKHASEHGYCWGCGQFWAGIESFDFNPRELCDNCDVEFSEPDYDEDDVYYPWYDLP